MFHDSAAGSAAAFAHLQKPRVSLDLVPILEISMDDDTIKSDAHDATFILQKDVFFWC